jgi:UDP-2,3-diacylglucosamine pyrophosphatase LpxH
MLPRMSGGYDQYDELYVVSDLHLGGYTRDGGAGGPRNLRMFHETAALTWLIGQLITRSQAAEGGAIGLVLNGDIVDFLAFEDATELNIDGAVAAIDRLLPTRDGAGEDEQAEIWRSLARYVSAPGKRRRELIMSIGNHDVELALPAVQHRLLEFLTGGDRDLRSRVTFVVDGAGFRVRVGSSRVLCVHGNEVDDWNVVDYPQLGRIRRALQHTSSPPKWNVNAGTTLVLRVLNQLKLKYQWIDLLKPEVETVGYIAASLRPAIRPFLPAIAPLAYRRARDHLRPAFLEAFERAAAGSAGSSFPQDADRLIESAEKRRGLDPLALVGEERSTDFLLWRELADAIKVYAAPSELREVLIKYLEPDTAFDHRAPDEYFEKLDELIGPEVDFLIAGHTHHQKALRRKRAQHYYFNSGTWISVLYLPPEALEEKAFEAVRKVLEDGSLEKLREPIEISTAGGVARKISLARTIRTVVRVKAESDGGAAGSLMNVVGEPGSYDLVTVDRATFSVGRRA